VRRALCDGCKGSWKAVGSAFEGLPLICEVKSRGGSRDVGNTLILLTSALTRDYMVRIKRGK
jgi:hypothetical protein